MCYKIVFNLIKVGLQFDEFSSYIPVTKTRGHPRRLFVRIAGNNTRIFFAHRVVEYFNFLPVETVDFCTLIRFRQTIIQVDFWSFLQLTNFCFILIIIIIIIVFNIAKSQRSTNICHAGQPMVLDQRWAAADSGPGQSAYRH